MQPPVPTRVFDGIIYDPVLLPQPQHELFETFYWQRKRLATSAEGGRGNVVFIDDGVHRWVLRHYRRGGLIGKLIADQYVWLGADATRSFREWRLLATLYAQGLPVPQPVAARYLRSGLVYRADLLTTTITGARTLAQRAAHGTLPYDAWRRVGETLAGFHAAGAQHADLNAHNIVFDAQQSVLLLDFDRGRLRAVKRGWINAGLKRLLRSLNKLYAQRKIHFTHDDWRHLLQAHDARLVQLRR
jgi:3-deoxy-D-manno-octulosonic acid kinase